VHSPVFQGAVMHIPLSIRMRRPAFGLALMTSLITLSVTLPARSQQAAIELPKPKVTGGMPLMEALSKRQTTRAFADKPLPLQTLSNLLWAAFGVNRPQEMKAGLGRTAPSAMNKQEVQLYVVLADGIYVYEAEQNRLRPVVAGDARGKVGTDAAVHAAVTIVYVSDAKLDYAQVDTGFIGQNVYLFAASEGLNAWLYAIHTVGVAGTLKLADGYKPLYGQSVGYPAN
jgi:nitroreductase